MVIITNNNSKTFYRGGTIMKKLLIFMLISTITFINLNFNSRNVYCYNTVFATTSNDKVDIEKNYVKELESISNQLNILSSNSLDTISTKKDNSSLLKDVAFIKSQIRNLRDELGVYHKTESGDIEKNPLSLSLLNTLNYYSMSLSYIQGFLESTNTSDASKYLERYYTSKGSGDESLLIIKEQLSE